MILNTLLQTSVRGMVAMIGEVIWKCCDKKVPGLITWTNFNSLSIYLYPYCCIPIIYSDYHNKTLFDIVWHVSVQLNQFQGHSGQ